MSGGISMRSYLLTILGSIIAISAIGAVWEILPETSPAVSKSNAADVRKPQVSDYSDGDIRKRTYAEVACFGELSKNNDRYECKDGLRMPSFEIDFAKCDVSNLREDEKDYHLSCPFGRGTAYFHTVTVNRRTGTVAFDNRIWGECRVADFDAWECTKRDPGRDFDIIRFRSSRKDVGYLEEYCSAAHDAPVVRSSKNCERYWGIPLSRQ
jgi:hypothetical protein